MLLSMGCLAVSCAPADSASDPEVMVLSSVPAEAVIRSVTVDPREIREGMRRVHVTVRLEADPPEEITVTEWVPVVLLGRLEVGASVHLVKDPARDRVTIGL